MGKKPMRFAIFDDVVKVIVTMADGFRIGPQSDRVHLDSACGQR